eukprot:661819-Amphidinium_carterae.1
MAVGHTDSRVAIGMDSGFGMALFFSLLRDFSMADHRVPKLHAWPGFKTALSNTRFLSNVFGSYLRQCNGTAASTL